MLPRRGKVVTTPWEPNYHGVGIGLPNRGIHFGNPGNRHYLLIYMSFGA